MSYLDSKQRHIQLEGLATNPVYCDCNARPLHRWLASKLADNTLYADLDQVKCSAPDFLAGKMLTSIQESDLTCEGRPTTTTTEVVYSTYSTTPSTELDIIWTTTSKKPKKSSPAPVPQPPASKSTHLANMDSLIIGIVGGVVAFITIIIIIICIIRLRLADNQYRGGPLAGPLAMRAQGKCTCLKPVHHPVPPMTPTMYAGNHHHAAAAAAAAGFISYPSTPVPPPPGPPPPPLALTWKGTVSSQKMLQGPASVHGSHFGTVGANSYLSTGNRSAVSRAGSVYPPPGPPGPPGAPGPFPTTPYYVTFPNDSDTEQDRRSHR